MVNRRKGVVLLTLIVMVGILSALTVSLFAGVGRTLALENKSNCSIAAFWTAEAGIEKACYELENTGPVYTGETTKLGNGIFTVTVTPADTRTYSIVSTGEAGRQYARKTIEVRVSLEQDAGRYRVKKMSWHEIM